MAYSVEDFFNEKSFKEMICTLVRQDKTLSNLPSSSEQTSMH